MLAAIEIGHMKLSPHRLSNNRFSIKMLNAVLNEDTGELMEY